MPIRHGQHKIAIAVHPEVEVGVTVTVARSADEANASIAARTSDRQGIRMRRRGPPAAGEFFDPAQRGD